MKNAMKFAAAAVAAPALMAGSLLLGVWIAHYTSAVVPALLRVAAHPAVAWALPPAPRPYASLSVSGPPVPLHCRRLPNGDATCE